MQGSDVDEGSLWLGRVVEIRKRIRDQKTFFLLEWFYRVNELKEVMEGESKMEEESAAKAAYSKMLNTMQAPTHFSERIAHSIPTVILTHSMTHMSGS